MKVCILLLAMLAFLPNAVAQSSLEIFVSALKRERAAAQQGPATLTIAGAGRAFLVANTHLRFTNQPMLYCPPSIALNAGNYAEIALEEYERRRLTLYAERTFHEGGADAMVFALLEGLVATFPCR